MLHDFRPDFRKGRVFPGLAARPDAEGFKSGVRQATNLRVLEDGTIERRWGTLIRRNLNAALRLETWEYGTSDDTEFLIVIEDARLKVYDMVDGVRLRVDEAAPWTGETGRFMSIEAAQDTVYFADNSFRTRQLTYRPGRGFEFKTLPFTLKRAGARLALPFVVFDEGVELLPKIFLPAESNNAMAEAISAALAIPVESFDITQGTGEITSTTDFFVADHVGTRMRLGEGEFEVTEVTDARTAQIKVWSPLAKRLGADPFYCRKGSVSVEVEELNHGHQIGDVLFFFGMEPDNVARLWMTQMPLAPTGGNAAVTSQAGTFRTYTIQRVLDENRYEINADQPHLEDLTQYAGGAGVYVIAVNGMKGVREPAFSVGRGWPQAVAVHESRLWLAGSRDIPDGIWASSIGDLSDFDPGDGSPADAIQLYSVGKEARIRHLVSGFDLVILSDASELYIPGSTEQAVTQETVRVVEATRHGAAYTTPRKFDGGIFMVQSNGKHVREMSVESREEEYRAPAATVLVPDWVQNPWDTTVYKGSRIDHSPYLLFVNGGDGSILVCHSSRMNDSFGFMRWTLKAGSFVSAAGIGDRLFALAKRADSGGEKVFLVEFMADRFTHQLDLVEEIEANGTFLQTSFLRTVPDAIAYVPGVLDEDVVIDNAGMATLQETHVGTVAVGQPMEFEVQMNPPVPMSPQGLKMGKMQRLVSAEIYWKQTATGFVEQEPIIDAAEVVLNDRGELIGWREYWIGKWDREPILRVHGARPGAFGIGGVTLNVHAR